MLETYRNMNLIYTNYAGLTEEVLKQGSIPFSVYISPLESKAVIVDADEEKRVLDYLESVDITDIDEAMQVVLKETDGTVWVFTRKRSK